MLREGLVAAVMAAGLLALGSLCPCGASQSTHQAEIEPTQASEFQHARATIPNFRVQSPAEYARIKQHHQLLLNDGVTIHSFELPDGTECRCIDATTQRALAAAGIAPEDFRFAPEVLPPEPPDGSPGRLAPGELAPGLPLDGSLDHQGRERRCPEGTVPRIVPGLEELCRFESLEARFAKGPDGAASFPGAPGDRETHLYATGSKTHSNIGIGANLNLWSPEIEHDAEFSLCQIWDTRGSGNDLQTLEAGWQVYEQVYSDKRAHLFIFYTTNNYTQLGDNLGCYNMDCVGFVQTSSSIFPMMGWSAYSSEGGSQYAITLEYFREPIYGDWWLRYGESEWIGYYPASLFDAAGLGPEADFMSFGGEVVDDDHGAPSTTDMGSGGFPDRALGYAAYVRRPHFWTPAAYVDVTDLNRTVTNASYYGYEGHTSTVPEWTYFFYYGGPGRPDKPLLELYYWNHDLDQCFAAGDLFDGRYRMTNDRASALPTDLYIIMGFLGNFWYWPDWGRDPNFKNLTVPGGGKLEGEFLRFVWPGDSGTLSGVTFYGVMMEPGTYNKQSDVVTLPLCALGSGDIQFTLEWTFGGGGEGPDLDLHVLNPNGYHLYYSNKHSPDGGELDFDDQGACGSGDGGGPENIYWRTGMAPRGRYEYWIDWYATCGTPSAYYTLTVRNGGTVAETQTGTLSGGDSPHYSIIY